MARGGVVDEHALALAISEGRLEGASDVFEDEPISLDDHIISPLADLKDFYGTHHIGGMTQQAQDAVGEGHLFIPMEKVVEANMLILSALMVYQVFVCIFVSNFLISCTIGPIFKFVTCKARYLALAGF
eukprot:CAMPEP_0184484502 /NCGR_PEP_ID=MMETSP0113_2-20130426/6215_1 /TAXON_ID=91329 /ORGANISM="Norrisiella sphaerica, Strain BC52" /LENGTH=128 /DNA_ID=CAMNT_0026865517 /DNA_START=337 /DNA_END=723 /DNA_ORIENTATION=-